MTDPMPVWTTHGDTLRCTCSRCADVAALCEALRSIRVLHDGEHHCGFLTEGRAPLVWTAMMGPCPTALIVDATLSGYGRGGPWPYS